MSAKRDLHKLIYRKEHTENDYYATDPKAAWLLMEVEKFTPTIWECACGEGHLAKEFVKAGYSVVATDLVNRGYGEGGWTSCNTPGNATAIS